MMFMTNASTGLFKLNSEIFITLNLSLHYFSVSDTRNLDFRIWPYRHESGSDNCITYL